MAPSSKQSNSYAKDEKVLCFHGESLYEAKILDTERIDPNDKKSLWKYKVHYKGWKNTWDDWVPEDRLKRFTEENREFASSMQREEKRRAKEEKEARKSTATAASKRKSTLGGSELGSVRLSEERSSSMQAPMRGTKRGRDYEIEKEETFTARPSIRIPLPDHLKGLLVDDWENITKSLQLVPLPHPHPVSAILAEYSASETSKRRPGSADADILEEVILGVREYFDKSLGRILLYRFERQQWLEVHERMIKSADGTTKVLPPSDAIDGEQSLAGKTPSEVYGAEHLCRLFVSMPELIAQTNMDQPSVNKLREELMKMTQWLGKNSSRFFAKEYMNAGQDYQDKSRGTG